MYKLINADYYGFRDEEDGVLVKLEAAAEKELRAEVRIIAPAQDLSRPLLSKRILGPACALAAVCGTALVREIQTGSLHVPELRVCQYCEAELSAYVTCCLHVLCTRSGIVLHPFRKGEPYRWRRLQAAEQWEKEDRARSEALAGAIKGLADFEERGAPEQEYVAYVPLPDQKEIEARVLAKKKADLLAKYTSESLQQEQLNARALLTKR